MAFLKICSLCVALLVVKSGVQAATIAPPPVGAIPDLFGSGLGSGGAGGPAGSQVVSGSFFGTGTTPSPLGAGAGTANNQPAPPSLQDILNDPVLWELTGTPPDPNYGPVAQPSTFATMQMGPQSLLNSILPWAATGADNVGNVVVADVLSKQMPGPMGPVFIHQSGIELPEAWLPVQMARQAAFNPRLALPAAFYTEQVM